MQRVVFFYFLLGRSARIDRDPRLPRLLLVNQLVLWLDILTALSTFTSKFLRRLTNPCNLAGIVPLIDLRA